MTKVAEIERIRWAHFREGLGIRELSRVFHRSRKTIRRALGDPGPWEYRQRKQKARPVMGPLIPIIERWLAEDETAPRKQRHTAQRVYDRLVAEHGFTGSVSSVRQWMHKRKQGTIAAHLVTLPLAHEAGKEAQMDFGEAIVRIAGVPTKVHLFCARLAYSTRDVVIAYTRQDRPAWLDGHVRTFATWGGAPESCWYDNPSGLGGFHARSFHPSQEFLALQIAYRFRAHHCTPGKGNEKGLVEGLVGYMRRNYLTPVPDVESLDELNASLAVRTLAEENRHRRGLPETVGERFAQERSMLAPLPTHPFLPCVRRPVRASHQALVMFERSRYSVPVRHAGQQLWLRAYCNHVEVWGTGAQVAHHHRATEPGELITDFWHYLPTLLRKPGAFRQAIPVQQASFPEEAKALLEALETRHRDDLRRAHREFLAICALQDEVGAARWRAACTSALGRGEISAAGVSAALLGVAPNIARPPLPAILSAIRVMAGDPSKYGQLVAARR